MSVSAIIVAGGTGKRLGKEIPKAFVPIAAKEIFLYSAQVFDEMHIFSEIIIVVPQTAIEETIRKTSGFSTKTIVVEGGKERHNSVENGLKYASGKKALIHDAARPFIDKKLVAGLLERAEDERICGVISANKIVDTVRKYDGELCGQTVNRDELIAVGTPQIFEKEILLECFAKMADSEKIPTDEAMLVQSFGHKVVWVDGSKLNFKITTPQDLILADAIVKIRNGEC